MAVARLRLYTPRDIPAMHEIYAPYVLETPISFELEPPGEAELARRMEALDERYPCLIYELNGEILGYAYAGEAGSRGAFAWSAVASVYIQRERRGGGVGGALYRALMGLLVAQGYVTLFAHITHPNPESEGFHEHLGFERQGVLRRAGCKFGKFRDVAYYAKSLSDSPGNPPRPKRLSELAPEQIEKVLKNSANR